MVLIISLNSNVHKLPENLASRNALTFVKIPDVVMCHMQLCWPFNTLVQIGNSYAFDFQAEDNVLDGLGWDVQNDTLTLFTTARIESAFPVILVVSPLFSLLHRIMPMHKTHTSSFKESSRCIEAGCRLQNMAA